MAVTGVAAVANAGDLASAVGRVGHPPEASLEQRIAAAEENIELIDKDLYTVQRRLEAEERARQLAVESEKDERVNGLQALRRAIDQETAQALPFSLFGVTWLALGLILSSTSVELAKWLGAR